MLSSPHPTDYLYRVDSLVNLRKIDDHFFRPAEWLPKSLFQHKRLVQLADNRSEQDHIYRICFWVTEQAAQSDKLIRESSPRSPMVVTRVLKSAVPAALPDWSFDIDDLVGPTACMYFKMLSIICVPTRFAPAGIPFRLFQCQLESGEWTSVTKAPALQLEPERMLRVGMESIKLDGNLGRYTVYWKVIPTKEYALAVIRQATSPVASLLIYENQVERIAEIILKSAQISLERENLKFSVVIEDKHYEYAFFKKLPSPLPDTFFNRLLRTVSPPATPQTQWEFKKCSQIPEDEFNATVANLGLQYEDL